MIRGDDHGVRIAEVLWDPTLLEALAARYLVILFDNRGIGGSTNTGPYDFTQLADDTAGLLEALRVGPAFVFGWSMGGSIALDLTVRRPELVTKAVLYAANCGGPHAIPPSPEVIAALSNTTGTREEQGRRLLPLLFPEAWLRHNGAMGESFLANGAGLAGSGRAPGPGHRAMAGNL